MTSYGAHFGSSDGELRETCESLIKLPPVRGAQPLDPATASSPFASSLSAAAAAGGDSAAKPFLTSTQVVGARVSQPLEVYGRYAPKARGKRNAENRLGWPQGCV